MSEQQEPTWDKESGWNCPEGYAHPRCGGCGHNFYGSKPKLKINGRAVSDGLCGWCLDEAAAEDDY